MGVRLADFSESQHLVRLVERASIRLLPYIGNDVTNIGLALLSKYRPFARRVISEPSAFSKQGEKHSLRNDQPPLRGSRLSPRG
jgi:hypothetical protein